MVARRTKCSPLWFWSCVLGYLEMPQQGCVWCQTHPSSCGNFTPFMCFYELLSRGLQLGFPREAAGEGQGVAGLRWQGTCPAGWWSVYEAAPIATWRPRQGGGLKKLWSAVVARFLWPCLITLLWELEFVVVCCYFTGSFVFRYLFKLCLRWLASIWES